MAGLESNNLIDFRRYGSQHAEADQFASIETVSANSNDLLLYRAYLGRTEVVGGTDIDVFIDDWQSFVGTARSARGTTASAMRWSRSLAHFVGDYNEDGVVDAADYVVWRKNSGLSVTLPNRDTANFGPISIDDFDSWRKTSGTRRRAAAALIVSRHRSRYSPVLAMLIVQLHACPSTAQ